MMIDSSSLDNALGQLLDSMDYLHSDLGKNDPKLYIQFRNSAIQCFEFTYELAYNMIHRQLTQIVKTPEDLKQLNFADLMRAAAEAGLITDVRRFLRYREMRNITSHTYDAEKAEAVVRVLNDFVNDVQYLLCELKKRNL